MMTKLQITDIRKRVQAVLDAEGKALGMTLKLGNITYDDDGFRTQLKGRWEDSLPEVCADYDSHQRRYDFPRRGSVIQFQGEHFQVHGYKKRARKRPIIITNMGGNQYVISKDALTNAPIIQEPEEAC